MKDEASLLRAARKFDQDALTAIFDMYAPAIYKYGLRLFRDPIKSDNLVGDVFAQLLEKLVSGQGPLANLRSYLYKIAYHLVVEGPRYNKLFPPLEVTPPSSGKLLNASTQATLEERILMEALISAMNNELSPDQRHVIILRFLEDFSLGETATIMGKNINNVKVIQNRAIAKLRKSLELYSEMESHENPSEAGSLPENASGKNGAGQDGNNAPLAGGDWLTAGQSD